MTSSHLVTNAKLPFRCDEDLDLLDRTGIDFLTALKLVEATLTVGIELAEATFEGGDDFKDVMGKVYTLRNAKT